MTQERLYEYAVIKHPTKEERDKGATSVLLVAPSYVLAVNENAVLIQASLKIPREEMNHADRLEVAVRPF